MFKMITFVITLFFIINAEVKAENIHLVEKHFNNTVHIIKINQFEKIKTVAKRPGENIYSFVKKNKAWGGINGGYFNHSDGFPVSKVYINSILVEDPKNNKALINNPNLKPIINTILNKRSEIRVSEYKGKKNIDIVANDQSIRVGEKIIYSLQSGPLLLPQINLEKEGFITKNKNGQVIRDGIASSQRAARSAIGINQKNEIIFVSVSAKPGITINQLAEIMKKSGALKAMALDGGSSVSMVWQNKGKYSYFSALGNNLAIINSGIIINH